MTETEISFQHFGLKWSQRSLWFKMCFRICVSSKGSVVECQKVWVQEESTLCVIKINLHMCTRLTALSLNVCACAHVSVYLTYFTRREEFGFSGFQTKCF